MRRTDVFRRSEKMICVCDGVYTKTEDEREGRRIGQTNRDHLMLVFSKCCSVLCFQHLFFVVYVLLSLSTYFKPNYDVFPKSNEGVLLPKQVFLFKFNL